MSDRVCVAAYDDGDGAGFSASIPGIPAAGGGADEAQAVRSLANVLGDFVDGHARTIAELRAAAGMPKDTRALMAS